MGQARKQRGKRSQRLIVRVNDEEQSAIRAAARNAGLRVSEYVRRMAVTGRVVVRPPSAYGMALASQIKRTGVLLNQLTRVANSSGEVPPELARLCGRLEIVLDRVVELE